MTPTNRPDAGDLLVLVLFGVAPVVAAVAVWGWSPLIPLVAVPAYLLVWMQRRSDALALDRLNLLVGVVVGAASTVAVLVQQGVATAGAIAALFVLVFAIQRFYRESTAFPYLLIFATFFLAYTAVGVVFAGAPLSGESRAVGVWLLVAFLACAFLFVALIGHFLSTRVKSNERAPITVGDLSVGAVSWVAVGGFVVANLLERGNLRDSLGAAVLAPRILEMVALVVLIQLGRQQGRRAPIVLAMSLAGLDLLLGFGLSSLYAGAGPAIVLFAASVAANRRVPVALLTLITLAALQLNVVKVEYRSQLGGIQNVQAQGVVGGILGFAAASQEVVLTNDPVVLADAATRFSYTADMLDFSYRNIPERLGYPGGESFRAAPLMLVPRFIWNEKPRSTFGNYYGHQLGLVNSRDYTTAKNISLPVEGYITAGPLGMFGAAALLGSLMALIGAYRGSRPIAWLVVGATTAGTFLGGVESDTTTWLAFLAVTPFVARASLWLIERLAMRDRATPLSADPPGERGSIADTAGSPFASV